MNLGQKIMRVNMALSTNVYGGNADAVQAVQARRADYNLAGTTVVAWVAKQNPRLATSYTIKTGLVWALAFVTMTKRI